MNELMSKILGASWRTTLAGIAAFLSGVPGFITALSSWAAHQPVNWREVGVSAALAALGAGLANAKDAQVHSTLLQVETSTVKAADAKNPAGNAVEVTKL
jgi:hypothetical protein